jgi:hypothetical protein
VGWGGPPTTPASANITRIVGMLTTARVRQT